MREINVETQEMKVVHGFQFDWVAEEVVVNEGLNGWMFKEMLIVDNKAVVNVAVVCEM